MARGRWLVLMAGWSASTWLTPALSQAPTPTRLRPQVVEALPGGLDTTPVLNDNNPELIVGPGVLLSTFDGGRPLGSLTLSDPAAHLNAPQTGTFELFSHHVYAGKPDTLASTLWLAVVAAPRGERPVELRLLAGSTALSQSVDGKEAQAPFLPLPPLMPQGLTPVWSGPGSRVATELLLRLPRAQREWPERWTLQPGTLTPLLVLPLPVKGLDPLLNGRNLQLRLNSDGPVDVATLAAFGPEGTPPPPEVWARILAGGLSPKEHVPTPRGAPGRMVYSRVSGVQRGATWTGRLTDPGQATLSASRAPISWPISSLERGTLGTGQVQTAELSALYPGTAWAAHGNYGVTYALTLPLRNDTRRPLRLALALESPVKTDAPQGGLKFRGGSGEAATGPVMFRGTVEVSGLDGPEGRPAGRQGFHLVQRAGQEGPPLGTVTLAPGATREVRVRLIYPADATPPQVLSLLPAPAPGGTAAAPPEAVKQSPVRPLSSDR
ncbi:MAG: DUF3370 domain-containing protein [Cyanobacteria bacterium K_Offshore_surface_m2_239]|nr:DUF3370 domain-containing protein [Cyanobacteria bacterium K_Offshore_surface_m2_239]